MKCPDCNGTGKDYNWLPVERCKTCGGIGLINMTNEEWFCGLSTETKARITHLVYMAGYRDGFNEAKAISLRDIKNWLKQPHTNEELTSK